MRKDLVKVAIVILVLPFLIASGHALAASEESQQISSFPDIKCEVTESAQEAIDSATRGLKKLTKFRTPERAPDVLDLIFQAEEADEPPECDSLKGSSLANKAERLAEENIVSLNTTGPAVKKSKDISPVLGLNFARVDFDDGIFSGSGNIFGFTVGASIDSRYEIGYELNGSSPAEFIFDDLFYSEPSLDSGSDLGTFEDAYLRSQLLYLRGHWPLGETVSWSGLIAYSEVELEIENATPDCSLFFLTGIPLCSEGETSTTYRNKESGIAWGVGLHWAKSPYSYLSLEFIDQSVDDFEFSGIHFSFGLRD